ncbi:MAG: hypothetical protein PVI41_06110 [Roseobacter sp.]
MRLLKRAAFDTMQGIEAAVAPFFIRLGVDPELPRDLDTDCFDTFTGEKPRAG